MNENNIDDRISVYEIGYLIAGSVTPEKVSEEEEKVKSIITKAGASVLADEAPHLEQLAYTMRVKTVSGSYEKYDKAYFGWIKFEVSSSVVESIKKTVELVPTVLRMILISTTKENTYLGKRASQIAATIMPKKAIEPGLGVGPIIDDKKDIAPISIEDMDKSIDDMVKEVK
ncbi:MAG: 30S ribosomal protein S6 [Candidatus Taylorbacteria bacterium]